MTAIGEASKRLCFPIIKTQWEQVWPPCKPADDEDELVVNVAVVVVEEDCSVLLVFVDVELSLTDVIEVETFCLVITAAGGAVVVVVVVVVTVVAVVVVVVWAELV